MWGALWWSWKKYNTLWKTRIYRFPIQYLITRKWGRLCFLFTLIIHIGQQSFLKRISNATKIHSYTYTGCMKICMNNKDICIQRTDLGSTQFSSSILFISVNHLMLFGCIYNLSNIIMMLTSIHIFYWSILFFKYMENKSYNALVDPCCTFWNKISYDK
jgi:hypothetical protein